MYKILIAEDEDIIRKGIMFSLPWEKLDCNIVGEARNGEEGIRQIEKLLPDIVITDINMPVMGGLEMIEQTQEKYGYSSIILSGYSEFTYARAAIHLGGTEYLLKPIQKEELKQAIERAKETQQIRVDESAGEKARRRMRSVDILSGYSDAHGDHPVQRMLDYVAEHFGEKIVMQDIVDTLNYSESFLNKRFKQQTGTTFTEYLNRYRIQKAIEYIGSTDLSSSDISRICGFGDVKYFNFVFKKYIGYTPKEYAAMISA